MDEQPPPTPGLPEGDFLPEMDGHRVWWCQCGPSDGMPVLVLHGGPGGRTRQAPFGWFGGLPVRCLAFDQRGCGQSTPSGSLQGNTLSDLLVDIERLRIRLGLDAWAIAGGSWGALLAIAYAGTHPGKVRGLYLRSAFLGSDVEVASFFALWPEWLGQAGAAWLGAAEPASPLAMMRRDNGAPDATGISPGRLARAWQAFEQLQGRPGGVAAWRGARFEPAAGEPPPHPDNMPPGMAVQLHYLQHACFAPPAALAQWLRVIDAALATRPIALVHGLADAVCDPEQTRTLARRWPDARATWVEGAGHDMDWPPMRAALTHAAIDWVARLAKA